MLISNKLLKTVLLLGLGIIILAITTFLLLADKPKAKISQQPSYLKAYLDNASNAAKQKELTARREEVLLERQVDSLTKLLLKKPKTNYVYIHEKISTNTNLYSDKQLDSLLTNYRYIPYTETGNR